MKIKAILFDLDGTIADTIPLTIHSLKEITKELTGKEMSDAEILKEFGPIDTAIIEKLVDNEKREISADKYIAHFEKNFHRYVEPMEGIKELLELIKSKGIKTGLFTGRSLRATKIVLQKLAISPLFDEILAGDDTKRPKPDPEGILKILSKLGVDSRDSMYVGDFDVDILASKAAGTFSVLALWSSTSSDELIHHQPDQYFRSPYGFIDWLNKNVD